MKRVLFALMIALALPAFLTAQAKPAAAQSLILEFVDGTDLTVTVDGKEKKFGAGIGEGDVVPVGATIKTGPTTTAELKLKPNGTILKLAKATTFTIANVATSDKDKNTFALVAGKVRTIAAKGGSYELKGQTAVCGVRGTDFSFSMEPGAKEELVVNKGNIAFQKIDASGKILAEIPVAAGEIADALSSVFAAAKFTAEQFNQAFGEMNFQKLIETDVPGHAEEIGAAPTGEAAAAAAAAASALAGTGNVETKPVTAETAGSTLAEGASKLTKSDVESAFVKWLRDVMGMELGSVTINDKTYSKAVVAPTFNFGKVKFGLYLPIIYSSNMFDPADWYHPNGNDEWSFGTQASPTDATKTLWETDPLAAGIDAMSDFALKIKFFELGRQLESKFFIKVGNLDDLTLGHGLIMRNYANDTEFPSVRRVGFNFGMDFTAVGLEALSSDLADLENGIYGARIYVRPIPKFPLAFGISSVIDIAPLQSLSKTVPTIAATYGDPMIVGAGLDLDLPIIREGPFMFRLFADVAAETEYWKSAPTDTSYGTTTGLKTELLYNPATSSINNWGAAGGIIGRLLVIDYRLEYRYYTGIFQPSLFDSTYDKTRAGIAIEYANYIKDPTTITSATSVMGVYGEGGFKFLKDKLTFDFGYMWPWDPAVKVADYADFSAFLKAQVGVTSDEFHAKLVIKKGLIPVFDVEGSILYDRRGIAQSILASTVDPVGSPFQLFDQQTTFSGEIAVPVPKTPNLKVAVIFAAIPSSTGVDANDWVDKAAGIPKMIPSISFETRLSF